MTVYRDGMSVDVAECAEKAGCEPLTTQGAVKQAACALKKARELAETATAEDDRDAVQARLLMGVADGWRQIATHVPLPVS